jgi:hypothetical protein
MIFDRRLEDVLLSKEIIEKKVKSFLPLTDEEINVLERGTLNLSTINRIENKQVELVEKFAEIGYWVEPITNKTWNKNSLFFYDDFERINKNMDTLRKSFFENKKMPKTPNVSYDFQTINDLEKILYELEEMIAEVRQNYAESGDVECGER